MRPGKSKEVFGMQKTFPGVKIEASPKYNDLKMTSFFFFSYFYNIKLTISPIQDSHG